MAVTGESRRGRPRSFDAEQVLDRSIEMFWREGFQAVTTRSLERAIGISQSSIYNAFGSKEGLFSQALERYKDRLRDQVLHHLTEDRPPVDAVVGFFHALAEWNANPSHPGCLVFSYCIENPGNEQLAIELRSEIEDQLSPHLTRLAPDARAAEEWTALTMLAVQGICTAARTGATPTEIRFAADAIAQQVRTWGAVTDPAR